MLLICSLFIFTVCTFSATASSSNTNKKHTQLILKIQHARSISKHLLSESISLDALSSSIKATGSITSNSNIKTQTTVTSSQQTTSSVVTGTSNLIIGNKNTKIYHISGQTGYHMSANNAVYFNTESEAQAAGYRKSYR